MNVLREKITFLTDKFIPASVECLYCNCKCSGSIYSLDQSNREFCMYLTEPTYSTLAYVILKDSYVNYNHFIFARILGIKIEMGKFFEIIEEMKKYLSTCELNTKEIQEYRKLVADYDIALSVPSIKIKSLREKYNIEEEDTYISTIQEFDKSFEFPDLETLILS